MKSKQLLTILALGMTCAVWAEADKAGVVVRINILIGAVVCPRVKVASHAVAEILCARNLAVLNG